MPGIAVSLCICAAFIFAGPASIVAAQVVKRPVLKENQWHTDSLDGTCTIDRVSGAPCKEFELELAADATYVIDMEARTAELDCLLRLKDETGRQWASDDDGGQGFNARIVFKCSRAGKYIVVATTFGGDSGSFALVVRRPLMIKNLYRHTDTFATAGLQWVRGLERVDRPFRTYPFQMTAGTTYRIEVIGEDANMHPALLVRTPENWVRARGETPLGRRNTAVEYTCPESGTYFVIVTAMKSDSRGRFELNVAPIPN